MAGWKKSWRRADNCEDGSDSRAMHVETTGKINFSIANGYHRVDAKKLLLLARLALSRLTAQPCFHKKISEMVL